MVTALVVLVCALFSRFLPTLGVAVSITPTTTTQSSVHTIYNHHNRNHNHDNDKDNDNNKDSNPSLSSSLSSSSSSSSSASNYHHRTTHTHTHTRATPLLDGLRGQLQLAGNILSETKPRLPTQQPVQCACRDYCGGRCFAPGCQTCAPEVFDGEEFLCLAAGPFGDGLLCEGGGDNSDTACCKPMDGAGGDGDDSSGTAACVITEGRECDCAVFPPMVPLFPPPPGRTYVDGRCTASGTSAARRMESAGGSSSSNTVTSSGSTPTFINTRWSRYGIVTSTAIVALGVMVTTIL